MTAPHTLYTVLGIAPDADPAAIDAAYRTRAEAAEGRADESSLLRVAYETLRHPGQRAAYDRKLARQAAEAASIVSTEGTPEPLRLRRSPTRNWLILLGAAGLTVGAFWLMKPKPAKAPPPVTIGTGIATAPTPAVAGQLAASVGEVPAMPAGEAAPRLTPPAVPTLPPTGIGIAPPASLPAAPMRGSKRPGFDARYLAWSVFFVGQRNLTGSGVLIGEDRILTNCHVLAGAALNGLAVAQSMTMKVSKVEKYARLDGEDACLLYAPGAGSDTIAWGNSAALTPGDTLHAMGHPGGSESVVWSEGRLRLRVERGGEIFLVSDNYCRPGSSGGPLLDDEGRLVGVVTAVQRFQAKGGDPKFGACISITEATARALLSKPLFPIALAPAQYIPNY